MIHLTRDWKKSTRSNGDANCVEVRQLGGRVEFRDSKDPAGSILSVPICAHERFVLGLRTDAFKRI